MPALKAYDEVIDFIVAGSDPRRVSEFTASPETRARVADLLARAKTDELSAEEASELAHYGQLEHLMRLAKARAKVHVAASNNS